VSWFDTEFRVLLAAIEFAAANGFDQHAWQLPSTLTSYCWRRGRWQDGLRIQEIAMEAARRLGEPQALAYARYLLGVAQTQLSNFTVAEMNLREALVSFRDLDDQVGEAAVLAGLGSLFDSQERPAEALEEFLAMLRIVKALGRWRTQGQLENCVGWQYAMLGQYDQALAHCHLALTLLREFGDSAATADTLDSLGLIYAKLGDKTTAKEYYNWAIELNRKISVPYGEAQSLSALGDILADEGDVTGACAAWLEALTIMETLRHPRAEKVKAKLVRHFGNNSHARLV
jgi:tetratricopeptide (TPR) repeat protein